MKWLAISIFFCGLSVLAERSQVQEFDCLIKSFDTKKIVMRCDGFDADTTVPRNSVAEDEIQKFQTGQKIRLSFQLDDLKKMKVANK